MSFEAKMTQNGFKLSEKIHEQNPYGKILIDEMLKEILPPKEKSFHS
jgi:hypothetical protein